MSAIADPSRWTREQIGARIAKWDRDLDVARQNILELMDDVDYRSLTGDGGLGTLELEGETKQRVTPVLAALEELWQVLPALGKVIEEANARYGKLPWFKDAEPLRELQELLDGESVLITTKTTYAQRGLLTPDEVTRTLRPERVLDAMIEAYGRAKAIVVEVGGAMRRFGPQIDGAARRLAELTPALPGAPELVRLEVRLAEARRQLVRDPLGLADAFDRDFLPAIERLGRAVEDARAERARIEAELAGGGDRIAALEAAHAEAAAAHAERRDKVLLEREPPAPFERAAIDELARWLERLRGVLQDGRWQAAGIGLANWRAQLDARLAECRTIAAENRRPLERRTELRGLLDGLKAKAADTGRAEDPRATELYRKAHALLYGRPTPILAAEALVHDYLAAVR